jgi:hypothetical protein
MLSTGRTTNCRIRGAQTGWLLISNICPGLDTRIDATSFRSDARAQQQLELLGNVRMWRDSDEPMMAGHVRSLG